MPELLHFPQKVSFDGAPFGSLYCQRETHTKTEREREGQRARERESLLTLQPDVVRAGALVLSHGDLERDGDGGQVGGHPRAAHARQAHCQHGGDYRAHAGEECRLLFRLVVVGVVVVVGKQVVFVHAASEQQSAATTFLPLGWARTKKQKTKRG